MSDLEAAHRRLDALLAQRDRVLLGVVGAPGAGKSTFAQQLLERARDGGVPSALIPMDGFHLAQHALDAMGLAGVKGAPQTFDAAGYLALLTRLRGVDGSPPRETVWAPEFDRSIENAVAGAIPVAPSTRLVITEGNYLLSPTQPWSRVRPLLDECWFLDLDDIERQRRLVARHRRYGRSETSARAHTLGSDEVNAAAVRATRDQADMVIHLAGT